MIRCVLVFNQYGKPRVGACGRVRWQTFEKQQAIPKQVVKIVADRDSAQQSAIIDASALFGEGVKIIYRTYATLCFAFAVDATESELSILDIIQVFVQALNACFPNICELDIVFNFDKVNYILDEIVVGGMVGNFNVQAIVDSAKANEVTKSMGSSASGGILSSGVLSGALFGLS